MAGRRKSPHSGAGSRASKVGEQIRQILGQLFLEGEIKDPRFEPARVTITEVEMSPDLSYATVWISIFADEPELKKGIQIALASATRMLRREVGAKLGLRHTPELRFSEDTSIAYGSKIERIFKEIDADRPAEAAGSTEPEPEK